VCSGASAVAASLVVAWAWTLASRPAAHKPQEEAVAQPADDGRPSPLRAGDGEIVLRVARLDVRLAGPSPEEERLDVLTRLAGGLKDEAVRLARDGPSEDVQLLGALSAHLLRRGVVGGAARLPAEKKPGLVPPLVRRLRDTEAEIDGCCRDALPVVADMLRPIGAAARESAERIEAGRGPAGDGADPAAAGPAPPLISVLVTHGLRLAEEADPVRRADLSADLASLLAPAIVLLSAGGDDEGAEELGDCMGDLLGWGVGDNLKQAEADGLPAPRQAEAEKVRERSAEVMAGLERNLAQVPAPARDGIQRAVQAGQANKGKPRPTAPDRKPKDRHAPPKKPKGKAG
jgi:hypothetical protein